MIIILSKYFLIQAHPGCVYEYDASITPNFPSGSGRETVGIMFINRCWSTTSHNITTGDADG